MLKFFRFLFSGQESGQAIIMFAVLSAGIMGIAGMAIEGGRLMVERGELTDGHARAVLAVPENDGRRRLAREIVTKGLTVRAAERAARWAGASRKPRREPAGTADPALVERVRIACERATGFRPKVTATRIEIPISDEHELAEFAEALERIA